MKRKPAPLSLITALLFVIAALAGLNQQRHYTRNLEEPGGIDDYKVTVADPNIFLQGFFTDGYLDMLEDMSTNIIKVRASGNRSYPNGLILQEAEVLDVFEGSEVSTGDTVNLAGSQFVYTPDKEVILYFTNLMQKDQEYLVFVEEKIKSPFTLEGHSLRLISTVPIPYFSYGTNTDTILRGEKVEAGEGQTSERVNYSELGSRTYLSQDGILLQDIHKRREDILDAFDPNYVK